MNGMKSRRGGGMRDVWRVVDGMVVCVSMVVCYSTVGREMRYNIIRINKVEGHNKHAVII